MPLPLILYRYLLRLALPILLLWVFVRLCKGKEAWRTLLEKFGLSQKKRADKHKSYPNKKTIWVHAVSVGESMSALTMIDALHQQYPDYHFLLTSGTVTSAQMISRHNAPYVTHQFVPFDTPAIMKRFLRQWQPHVILMVESEIWPNLLYQGRQQCPIFLLQGRMSKKTATRWQKYPKTAHYIMQSYRMVFAQSQRDAEAFQILGAPNVMVSGNLKYLNPPLPYDETQLATLKQEIGDRKFYIATSTHQGEEEILLQAHQQLAQKFDGFLTIIIPRHPERGDAIRKIIEAQQLSCAQRSLHQPCDKDIYLADSLGELGLFYRLADIAFVGGSLLPYGGHNIYEAIQHDCICLHGKFMDNFADMSAELQQADLAYHIEHGKDDTETATALAQQISDMLKKPAMVKSHQKRNQNFIASRPEMLAPITQELSGYL